MGQLLDPNHASILKSAAASGQPSRQVLHGTAGGMSPQVQARSQQLPGSTLDMKSEKNPVLNPKAAGPGGSLLGISGSNQGNNNLTLKGWPLTGLEQLRSGLLQQQKLMLAQQSLASPSVSEESRILRMLLSNRNIGLNKDGLSNPKPSFSSWRYRHANEAQLQQQQQQ